MFIRIECLSVLEIEFLVLEVLYSVWSQGKRFLILFLPDLTHKTVTLEFTQETKIKGSEYKVLLYLLFRINFIFILINEFYHRILWPESAPELRISKSLAEVWRKPRQVSRVRGPKQPSNRGLAL